MQAILALIHSPESDVLGITVLTGDAWRDEEVQHTLRLMEIIGRTDIPVVPGAAFPLVSSKEYIAKWETLYGKILYQGAWNHGHPSTDPTKFRLCPMVHPQRRLQPKAPLISWSAWSARTRARSPFTQPAQ